GASQGYRTPLTARAVTLWPGASADGDAVDVAVLDLHDVLGLLVEVAGEVLGDRHAAGPAPGAAEGDHGVRLALGDVLRQEEVEQRQDAAVEHGQPAVGGDVGDDTRVEAGERPQVG